MKYAFTKLKWDSDFFSFKVGKIKGPVGCSEDINEIVKLINENDSRLTYLISAKQISNQLLNNRDHDILLVDKKTTYTKILNPDTKFSPSIIKYQDTKPDDRLIDLAIQSGIYSRLNIDKRIGRKKFEEMYSLWIINSTNGKIAKEVLVYKKSGVISGFVTLGEKNNRADIGIIAVDCALRGKGIGKTLLSSAENRFFEKGYKTIQVVTQADNIPACRLYESCGYKVESVEYFYHIWKNN